MLSRHNHYGRVVDVVEGMDLGAAEIAVIM